MLKYFVGGLKTHNTTGIPVLVTRYGIPVMSAVLGKAEEYHSDFEEWERYVKQVEQFFMANS